MDDRLRPHVIAGLLLRWLDQDAPRATGGAVDVDALAERLEIAVAPFNPGDGAVGALGYLEPGEDLIFLRAGLAEPIRRFTLAHELGHVVLHRRSGAAATLVGALVGASPGRADEEPTGCGEAELAASFDVLDGEEELLRPGEAYSAHARREHEANAFAAALLMPAERVRAAVLAGERGGARGAASGAGFTARRLARRFGVSEDVALRRLAALLLSPEEESLPEASAAAPARAPAALDNTQRAAAEVAAPALVIAGPGTGKTSTLVGRVAYLVRERAVAPAQILALTFSNKAAREMRERIASLLVEPDLAPAAPDLPTVSTIHAFCGGLLRRYAPHIGLRPDFRLVTEPEGYFLLRQVMSDLPLTYYQPVSAPARYVPDLLGAISRAKDELAGPEDYAAAAERMCASAETEAEREAAARAAEVATIYAVYQRALSQRGDPDYGDIIRLAVRLLRERAEVCAEVRARFAHILVDEFQDINRAMGILLQVLAGEGGPLWAVGDADQAIYRFRGASPANLANFAAEYPGARICRLERNYRSVPAILDSAAALASDFLGGGGRAPLEAVRPAGEPRAITLATAPDERRELTGLVRAIQECHAAGRGFGEQAVLCRTRRQAQQVAAALRAAGIPVTTGIPLLEQDEIKRLLAIPQLLADARGAGWVRAGELAAHAFSRAEARVLLREARARGTSPLALAAQAPEADLPGVSQAGARSMARLARMVARLRHSPDVATGLSRYVFSVTDLGRLVLAASCHAVPGGRERARWLGLLLAFARGFDETGYGRLGPQHAARGGAAWAHFLDYARVMLLLRQSLDGADDALAAGERGAVRVLTVHKSKGLEFPVVYLPGLAALRFPMRRMGEPMPLPPALGGDLGEFMVGDGSSDPHLMEEACLCYVALTRARDSLILSHASRYGRGGVAYQPSPFLAPILRRLGGVIARVTWADEAAGGEGAGEAMGAGEHTKPLSLAEIETYLRCPRRYAYQYVDGLYGQEAAFAALRQALRETLSALRSPAAADEGGAPTAAGSAPVASLEQALALFDRSWSAAHDAMPEEGREDATRVVLQRYGQQVIAREWAELGATQADPAAPRVEYDLPMTVRAGNRDIQLTVDLIEHPMPGEQGGEGGGRAAEPRAVTQPVRAPIRLVRHRITSGEARPDVRSLLYALAAEQVGADGRPVEVTQRHQLTGERSLIQVSSRQGARLREELAGAIQGIEAGRFPARPEPRTCAGCPFLFICPA